MHLSIVIPFYNEVESVREVILEVQQTNPGAEVIAIDDGSQDGTWQALQLIPGILAFRFPHNLGQSAAIYFGLLQCHGELCAMMDGDGQNDPADIPRLVSMAQQFDLVCGYRAKRQDSWNRKMASRIGNGVRNFFLRDNIRDTGCSLKIVRRKHVRYLVPFNGMHRYIPALLLNYGVSMVEAPVNHRPRSKGISKYTNFGRAWRGIRDLIGVSWLLSRKIHFDPALTLPMDGTAYPLVQVESNSTHDLRRVKLPSNVVTRSR